MTQAYIVEAARTAGGKRKGAFAGVHPADLGAAVVDALVARSGVDPAAIDDLILGCVTQGGKAQPGCQSLGVTFCRFAIDKQAQPFFEAEAFEHGTGAALLVQGLCHTGQPDRLQAVASGMCQQGSSPFQ